MSVDTEGVRPSEGWGVLHLLLRARRGEGGAEAVVAAIDAFTATEPQQVLAFSVLGSRAELGLMAGRRYCVPYCNQGQCSFVGAGLSCEESWVGTSTDDVCVPG